MIEALHQWKPERIAECKDFCERYIEAEPARRFVFGCNVYGRALAESLEVSAFVETEATRASFCNLPVIPLSEVRKDAIVVSCSGGRPLSALNALHGANVDCIDYFAFRTWSGLSLPDAVFNEDGPAQLLANSAKLEQIYSILADEESRRTLKRIVDFRTSYDIECLSAFRNREVTQYFESFINYDVPEATFVDVGCFDGFTTEEFLRRVPNAARVIALEPDPKSFRVCVERLKEHAVVSVVNCAAGSHQGTLCFASNGSGSAIKPDGEISVAVDRLDQMVAAVPSLIKMDIEGAELEALEGSRELILRDGPVLAICVYHAPSHLWEIYDKVVSMRSDYAVFVRHYTESIYETVMYFVPKGKVGL